MLPLFSLLILIFGQHPSTDNNFQLIDDFENHQKSFRADTFDLVDQSTDGGQLIVYHNKNKDYLVFDIWLFGETGKVHATYWTDRKVNFKIIRRTDFTYDKPYYEKGYTVTESTEYLSYLDQSILRYDADKKKLDNALTNEKKTEGEDLFKAVTKGVKLVK